MDLLGGAEEGEEAAADEGADGARQTLTKRKTVAIIEHRTAHADTSSCHFEDPGTLRSKDRAGEAR